MGLGVRLPLREQQRGGVVGRQPEPVLGVGALAPVVLGGDREVEIAVAQVGQAADEVAAGGGVHRARSAASARDTSASALAEAANWPPVGRPWAGVGRCS